MTGFRDMSRMKKVWERTTQYFRRTNSQDLTGKTEQQAADVIVSTPLWRKKSTQIIGGAAVLLTVAGIIGYQQYTQYVERNTFQFYHVYMNGEAVGTVENPGAVDQLVDAAAVKVQQANPDVTMVLDSGDITYESDSAFKAVPETDATLAKLESMFTSHAVGVEVKIEGKVIGVVKDQATADSILKRVQSKFAPELAAAAKGAKTVTTLSYNKDGKVEASETEDAKEHTEPGKVVTEVSFVEEVQVASVDISPTEIAEGEEIYKKIIDGSTKPTKYVVQAGDCIGCIAQKFDISPQVIYENNPWIEDDRITVGDELDLTVLQPELTVRTVESLVELEKIAAPVEVRKNDKIRVGQSKVIRQGVEGTQRLTYEIVKQNGYVVTEELMNKEVIVEPISEIVEKGTMVVLGEGTGKFAIPVKNYRITSKYGQRWGRLHSGIDFIGNKSILASDSGIVEVVESRRGTGKTIIINHQNGFKTLYGHLSSYSVKKGEKVQKGDKIGVMGNTGNSTGTHLHFEIHKKGVPQNPMKYL
ncbi:M23 family metallopeptidase [Paenibacillus sp. 1011MAR3C5]|uniref:M23 family metallopeptidase n=1 Tax=Paenibacillus sp. 1011MAR3C5 TaxID=1675787 RepID=UPI000E6C60B2|nr:M23 family metallopeptidase [Paenibacillus sp. 1011MAR3C5]RJE83277.1 M23 family metallopeptidase [Paenibacillus sp. 1011MAR3C5]